MMRITGLSHLFKWENLHTWWLTKYFFAPLYFKMWPVQIYVYLFTCICCRMHNNECDFSYESFIIFMISE